MSGADKVSQRRRDLGERLAEYREAANLTQHQLAPLIYYGRSTVANAETGRQLAARVFWERCDDVLHASGALVAAYDATRSAAQDRRQRSQRTVIGTWAGQDQFVSAGGTTAEPAAQHLAVSKQTMDRWAEADTVELVSQLTRKDLVLNRRELARSLALVACGAPLLEVVEQCLSIGADSPATDSPGKVGDDELTQIENAARLFRDWDDQFGGGLRRKAVIGQLNEVADLLRDSHPKEIQRRLYGALAHLSQTAAGMSWDSGMQGLAQQYYALSFRAAKTAGDRPFAANVLAGMARQLTYLGHPDDALELVRLAQDCAAGRATPAVRAMLFTREAWAYAKQGRITAFRRATEKAEDALVEINAAEEPHWIGYFDQAELDGTTGGRLLDLAYDDPRHATAAVDRINRTIRLRQAGRRRSSTLDYPALAEARLLHGE